MYFLFSEYYNSNYIVCHPINPIGESGLRKTTLEDLALVCANCHRMLHKKIDDKYLSITELKTRIGKITAANI